MKKVFISQPMKGKTDEQIERERSLAIQRVTESLGEEVEVIDTFFKDFNGNRLQFLGKSIMEGLARADIAVFVGDWEHYAGCLCEHYIAEQYGIPKFYCTPTQ
jgi:hypothetical protein